jgi:hypothetical protein
MSAQTLTVPNTVPEAVATASNAVPDTVPEAVGKPSGTEPRKFSLPWMRELALQVRKKIREKGIKNLNYFVNKEIIRKIIFEVGGFQTWAKSRAWKKYDLKKFYSKFVVENYTIRNKVLGIVPLKLPRTSSGKFNKEAFRIVAEKLRYRACITEKNEEAFRRNALKMFGLKKWDRSKFQGKLTFSKFFKDYVLHDTEDVNICCREEDFRGETREELPLDYSIDYRRLIACNAVVPELSDDDICSLCLDEIDTSDPNKVFVSACNHKFHYECVRGGYEHLFVGYRRYFKCPNCRQHSNVDRVVQDNDMYNQQDNWRYSRFE